jgi:hypothetical protein
VAHTAWVRPVVRIVCADSTARFRVASSPTKLLAQLHV